jgi:hypothetical protein
LFTTDKELHLGGSIGYVITLAEPSQQGVSLRCIGKILRHHRTANSDRPAFDIAVTLERYEFLRTEKAERGLTAGSPSRLSSRHIRTSSARTRSSVSSCPFTR